jgi:hypothetical protein
MDKLFDMYTCVYIQRVPVANKVKWLTISGFKLETSSKGQPHEAVLDVSAWISDCRVMLVPTTATAIPNTSTPKSKQRKMGVNLSSFRPRSAGMMKARYDAPDVQVDQSTTVSTEEVT